MSEVCYNKLFASSFCLTCESLTNMFKVLLILLQNIHGIVGGTSRATYITPTGDS